MKNMIDFESKEFYTVDDFRRLMAFLRSEGGCPWDREQTHESIRRNMLEEAYELCEAIDQNDLEHMKEELGDVLMQVLFHARIEEEAGHFDIDDIANAACRKLIDRHPHIFGGAEVSGMDEALNNWEEIKRLEKEQTTVAKAMSDVAVTLPALWRAEKILKKASRAGVAWPDIDMPADKLCRAAYDLRESAETGGGDNIADKLGDVLLCAVGTAVIAGADPESVLHKACESFIEKFRHEEEREGK